MKFVALYRQPEDPAAFDAAYAQHLKLVDFVPHTLGYTVTRFNRSLGGESLYLMFELHFADRDAMKAAMSSPEMAALGQDAQQFAAQTISMALGAEQPAP